MDQKTDGDGNTLIPKNPKDYGSVNGEPEVTSVMGDPARPAAITRQERLLVVSFCIANFCVGTFYALLGPFFPNEATKMGSSAMMTGLIYGIYELVFVVVSPIAGSFLTTIGAKFMFVSGMMVCGFCCVLFGFLNYGPPNGPFIGLAVTLRCFEGLGAGAMTTASFAILGFTFPGRVTTMFGALQLFTGLGLMLGPPIGGALFQIGGFVTPFAISGGVLIAVGILSIFTVPNPQVDTPKTSASIVSLLATPMVPVVGLVLMSGSGCIGFVDVTLSPVLINKFGLSTFVSSLIFLVGPGVYALTSPIWGVVADLTPRNSAFIPVVGYMIGGLSFWLLGPAPFLNIPIHALWLVILAQCMMGIGLGTAVVTFQLITQAARDKGYADSLETFGLVAGVFSAFFSTGAFLGPLIGGALQDAMGFAVASYMIGTVCMIAALLLLVVTMVKRCYITKKDRHTKP